MFLAAEDISDLQIIMNSQLENTLNACRHISKVTGKTYKDHKANILSWFYKDQGRKQRNENIKYPTWEEYDKGEHL